MTFNKIIKSPNDKREYFWTELDNKLKVIIIEDNNSTTCGALLNVNVGSVNEEIDGLAHFLEHMVFMGSSKYPNESHFMDYVKKNGGYTNAMTADSDTTYYFSIIDNKFLDALDMFSWFFIDPLLKKESIEKEINAVDSESKKNLLDEGWIFNEILKLTMNINHPINHYTCGDNESLVGDDLIDKVKDFFNKYYSSNLMRLIVFTNKKITTELLFDKIKNTFGKIKNNNVYINSNHGTILNPLNIIKYIPTKSYNALYICTEFSTYKNVIDNPSYILDFILTSHSDNSIYNIYHDKFKIIDIDFYNLYSYKDNSVSVVEISLKNKENNSAYTDDEISEIIKIFFDYIKSIKKSKTLKNIYENIKTINNRRFLIPTAMSQTSTILYFNKLLSHGMNIENLLDFSIRKSNYDSIENDILHFLDNYNDVNSSYIYASSYLHIDSPLKLNRFNTLYSINRFEPCQLLTQKYDIIKPNIYFSDKINLIEGDDYYPIKHPETIKKNGYDLIYNFNSSFKTPHVLTILKIETSLFKNSDLYTKILLYLDTIVFKNRKIITELNDATYDISINVYLNEIIIYINSDNNNIEQIYEVFNNIYNKTSGDNYNYIYDLMYDNHKNFKNESPMKKIGILTSKLLLENQYTSYDILTSLKKKFTFENCKDAFVKLTQKANVLMLMSGNIDKKYALEMADKLFSYLNIKDSVSTHINKLNEFHKITTPFIKKYSNKNKHEQNNVFTLIYKFTYIEKGSKDWDKFIAFSFILETITSSLYFNILRTQEQIGYTVTAYIANIGQYNKSLYGIKFIVQSYKKKSKYIYNRTLNFVKNELNTFINNLTEEDFEDYKSGEIASFLNNFSNLKTLSSYLYTHAFDGSYMYDYRNIITDRLKYFTIDEFKNMFVYHMITNPTLISVSIDSKKN